MKRLILNLTPLCFVFTRLAVEPQLFIPPSASPSPADETLANYFRHETGALPEQQEIVRRVEGLFALADPLDERLAKARGQVEKLTPCLLARDFAGKLVPQNHTDKPDEKPLERIRNGGTDKA